MIRQNGAIGGNYFDQISHGAAEGNAKPYWSPFHSLISQYAPYFYRPKARIGITLKTLKRRFNKANFSLSLQT